MRLSAVYILYQGLTLDYCFEESIRASLDLCDEVYINEGGSKDGTREVLAALEGEYSKDRLKIYDRLWQHDRGFWARERNFLLDKINPNDYVINLGADECLHEADFDGIRSSLSEIKALQFYPVHFYGRPKYHIQGSGWSKVLTKAWINKAGIRYVNRPGGCADDPIWPNGQPVHFSNCINKGHVVYHYGHCRDPKAAGGRQAKADSFYRNEDTYADGSIPTVNFDYKLEDKIASGEVKTFPYSHPKYMEEWVEKHKNQETRWLE